MDSSHRWIWHEFGDSFVDSAILRCAYDMGSFMTEYCPKLKTRLLPRRAWQLLRRCLGKARRFSPAFIEVELQELERSRRCVRQLQQSQVVKREDRPYLEQIYKRVPKPLAAGARVSCYLQGRAHMGIIDGMVLSFEPEDSTYLVRFVLNGKASVFCLPDFRIKSEEPFVGLPLFNIMKAIDSNREIFRNESIVKGDYSAKLLESIVQVRKLLAIKKKAVQEISEQNEEFEPGKDSSASSSHRRDSKTSSQRDKVQRCLASNMITLHRVNADVVAPMTVLHEHLAQYRKEIEAKEARISTALESYGKCCRQAEVDLQFAEKNKNLKLKTSSTRDLVQALQTILYVTGELGRPNSADMLLILDNLISHMSKNLPPALGAHFQRTMAEVKPLRQHMIDIFKIVPKEKPTEDTQQESPERSMEEAFIRNLIAEAQPEDTFVNHLTNI